jgi:hypothetical protein
MGRGRKLYYDVVLTEGAPSAVVAPTLTPDRNGNLLDRLPALTGNATASQKAQQELTAIFVPYSQEADAGEFEFVDAISGDEGAERFFPNGTGFQGPIVLQFTGGDVNPATAILDTTVIITQDNPGTYFFSLEPVDDTILVHLLEGEGGEVSDDWVDLGTEITIELTSGLEDDEGDALTNPTPGPGSWEWTNI